MTRIILKLHVAIYTSLLSKFFPSLLVYEESIRPLLLRGHSKAFAALMFWFVDTVEEHYHVKTQKAAFLIVFVSTV